MEDLFDADDDKARRKYISSKTDNVSYSSIIAEIDSIKASGQGL